MRKFFVTITFVAILLGAFYAYSVYRAEEDDIVAILHENSFLPITPSTADTVGTIYFVDLLDFSKITQLCRTPEELLEKYVQESRSADVGGARNWYGTLTSKLKAKPGQVINEDISIDDKRSIKTLYELTHVHVYEIDAASGKELYDKLMFRPSCKNVVNDYLKRSGYVCQALQILVASYKDNSEIGGETSLGADIKKPLGSDTEAETDIKMNDNDGKTRAGHDLQLGIQMAPSCISPDWAWSLRTFPRNKFYRMLDFIKFAILEPVRPAT